MVDRSLATYVVGERTLWSDGLGAELLRIGRVCRLRRHCEGVVWCVWCVWWMWVCSLQVQRQFTAHTALACGRSAELVRSWWKLCRCCL